MYTFSVVAKSVSIFKINWNCNFGVYWGYIWVTQNSEDRGYNYSEGSSLEVKSEDDAGHAFSNQRPRMEMADSLLSPPTDPHLQDSSAGYWAIKGQAKRIQTYDLIEVSQVKIQKQ